MQTSTQYQQKNKDICTTRITLLKPFWVYIVSLIVILNYISALECTKGIGILKTLSARKKDISCVFNAKAFVIVLLKNMLLRHFDKRVNCIF